MPFKTSNVMGKVFCGLLERARKIELRVSGSVERAAQRLTQSAGRTPLERLPTRSWTW